MVEMADGWQHPSKVAGKSYLISRLSSTTSQQNYPTHNLTWGSNNGMQQSFLHPAFRASGLEFVSPASPVVVQGPAEKGESSFLVDFYGGSICCCIQDCWSPIKRVKLMIQNQDEMIKAGILSEPYEGISDYFGRTRNDEGVIALWRGNIANVIGCFPTQTESQVEATIGLTPASPTPQRQQKGC